MAKCPAQCTKTGEMSTHITVMRTVHAKSKSDMEKLWAEHARTVTECRGLHDAWIQGIIVGIGLCTDLPPTKRQREMAAAGAGIARLRTYPCTKEKT